VSEIAARCNQLERDVLRMFEEIVEEIWGPSLPFGDVRRPPGGVRYVLLLLCNRYLIQALPSGKPVA
jgi:hypothetical protein